MRSILRHTYLQRAGSLGAKGQSYWAGAEIFWATVKRDRRYHVKRIAVELGLFTVLIRPSTFEVNKNLSDGLVRPRLARRSRRKHKAWGVSPRITLHKARNGHE